MANCVPRERGSASAPYERPVPCATVPPHAARPTDRLNRPRQTEAVGYMDLSKLNGNEKLAAYGAVASIVGAILATVGFGGGVLWLTLLLGVAMLVVLFLPQWSPQTTLPGSRGSLMLVIGGIGGVSAVLALLTVLPALGLIGLYGGLWLVGILIGIAGGLLMGWASWQAFQAEGGKFTIGTASAPAAPSSQPPQAQASPPPPAAPMSSGQGGTPNPPIGTADQSDEDRTL
jgi:hypothetical protein